LLRDAHFWKAALGTLLQLASFLLFEVDLALLNQMIFFHGDFSTPWSTVEEFPRTIQITGNAYNT
jgi:hypothetical protein